MKKIILFLFFYIVISHFSLFAKSPFEVPFSQLKEYLKSGSYSGKKKSAFFQLYLKTNGQIDEDGIVFFKEFILKPEACDSKEVFEVVGSFLIENKHISNQFTGEIKKAINENLKNSDYIVWCLELLKSVSLLSFDFENGDINSEFEKKYLKQLDNNNEYIVEIYQKTDYKVFSAAIKQQSKIIIGTEGILYDREGKKYSIIKCIIDDIEKSKNKNLLRYLNESNGWRIAFIQKKDIPVFLKIADNASLFKDVRNEAASILSQIFYIQKEKNITWSKWYSEHIDSFNRVEAAKKAIFNSKLQDGIRVATMKYLANSFNKPPGEKFLDTISAMVKSTKSIKLCFQTAILLEHYLEKFPHDEKLKNIYKITMKNCRRIYKDYKPSSDDKIYYYIPPEKTTQEKTQTPNTDAELEEFFKD